MLTPEGIDKIIAVAAPTEIDYVSRKWTSKPVHLLVPPKPDVVLVNTLQGLVDLYAGDLDEVKTKGKVLIHITSPTSVSIVAKDVDPWGRLRVYATAEYPKAVQQFPFGQFIDPEKFIIAAHIGYGSLAYHSLFRCVAQQRLPPFDDVAIQFSIRVFIWKSVSGWQCA
jgi:hypothetical protein